VSASDPAATGELGGVAGPISRLGRSAETFVRELGRLAHFAGRVVAALASRPLRIRRGLDELYDVGVLSLAVIGASGLAVGMVLGLQGYNTLVRFGAEESLGAVVGLSLIRELGPVFTALLVTGRAASAAAAEIGSMVASEQLDGLRMMSIDPVHYVVAPKVVAMVVAMPLLSALFIVLGLVGGYLVGVMLLGVDPGSYVSALEVNVGFREDVVPSLVKALVFGVLVALIATFRGFHAAPHAAGVSAATTSTVVIASVTTLIVDYILTALLGV
jgi:phospholipid/cholesterol/gamma-HCH transport system permease protein